MKKRSAVQEFFSGWEHLGKFLYGYWQAYGGIKSVIKSPYLHISLLALILGRNVWSNPNWWDITLSTHPAILGFSIAGLGFVLSFGMSGHGFTTILCATSKPDQSELLTPLGKAGALFIHYILLQFAALAMAILAKYSYTQPAPAWAEFLANDGFVHAFWALCVFLGIYSLMLAIAVAEVLFTLLRLTITYQKRAARKKDPDTP